MVTVLSSEGMASSRRQPPQTIGELIRQLRSACDMTQAEVAARADLTVWQLSRIESGKAEPQRETIERLARVLGVSPAYLDVRALSEAVAERATDPEARAVLARILNMHDRLAVMSDRDLKRLFRLLDELERGASR